MFVFDSGTIQEVNERDELAMQRFRNYYNFHASDLNEFPKENGVRVFEHNGRVVIVGDRLCDIAAEVELQTE